MLSASPWIVRAGGILLAVSFFIPQHAAGAASYSPLGFLGALSKILPPAELFAFGAWLAVPAATGVLLLAASFLKNEGGAFLRAVFVSMLLAGAFALATVGSIQLTTTQPYNGILMPSMPLSLLLFLVPLGLAAVTLARVLGGADARKTGSFARIAVALFVLLNGLFLADFAWAAMDVWIQNPGAGRILAGAWAAPAGALLVATGEILRRLPASSNPLPAVDLPHPSG